MYVSRMKKQPPSTALAGRKAEARHNDQRILDAAREVFLKDPRAPIAAVARRAGVGIGALYRRYRSKSVLLGRLCSDGLKRYITEAEAALADDGDPWAAYALFMRRIVEADTHSHVLRLAGTFKPSKALYREAERAQELNLRLFGRTKSAGVLRSDVEPTDIALLFEQLAAIRIGDADRTAQLRQRYLTLILESLTARSAPPLPGRAPEWREINGRWD
jgi:AcrR family transcriptional regulator